VSEQQVKLSDSLISKFWAKVDRGTDDACWLWTACTHRNGYGKFSTPFTDRAHRVSWILTYGVVPTLYVCHTCDNRLCINPRHLFLGSAADNIYDKTQKGRQAKGTSHGMAKLTENQVLQIRTLDLPQRAIASIYGVSQSLVCYIKGRKAWKSLK